MPTFQGHQNPNQHHAQQPPLKKHKTASGAVVTYYPPPPGYVPNAQASAAAWQTGQYNYSPAQQAWMQQYYQQYGQHYPGYAQANTWQQTQGYPPAQQYPGSAQPQQPYQPQPQPLGTQPYPQQQYPPQFNPQQAYSQPYPNATQIPPAPAGTWTGQPAYPGPSAGSPQDPYAGFVKPAVPASAVQYPQERQSRAVSITVSTTSDSAADDESQLAHPFDEIDFCRESNFAKDGDSIDPKFSLGTIVYTASRPVKRPLASTYDEAEISVTNDGEHEDGSISKYFEQDKIVEATSSVRQSSQWEEIKDDMIFREYPRADVARYVPISEVKAARERPDLSPDRRYPPLPDLTPARSLTPESQQAAAVAPERSSKPEESNDEEDAAMDLSSDDEALLDVKQEDGIEERVIAKRKADQMETDQEGGVDEDNDISSRNQNGFPKVSQDRPAHASRHMASPPSARGHANGHKPGASRLNSGNDFNNDKRNDRMPPRRHDSYRRSSDLHMDYGPHNVPPPPEPVDYDNPWRRPESFERRGSTGSNTSQRTAPGGDFNRGDHDRTPKTRPPTDQNGSGRKRGHEEMESQHTHDGNRWRNKDAQPRRRFRARNAEPYDSRRW